MVTKEQAVVQEAEYHTHKTWNYLTPQKWNGDGG